MLKLNKNLLIGALFCLLFSVIYAQPLGVIKHFSHQENLSQSRIIDIKQDKKGFIWLATFNGLIRYDGSTFRNFKVMRNDSLNLKSNRVFYFEFDKADRIWIQSENNEIYYFNTNTLSFHYPLEGVEHFPEDLKFKKFKILPSGQVWLFPENESYLVCLNSNKQVRKIDLSLVALKSEQVNDVYEDDLGKTWLLTHAGICKLEQDKVVSDFFFFNLNEANNASLLFSYVMETEEEMWFGGLNGKLIRYAKKANTFLDFNIEIEGDIVRMEPLKNNKVLIFTKNKGFYLYDVTSGQLEGFNHHVLTHFPEGDITYMGLTNANELWFETEGQGVYQFNLSSKKLSYLFSEAKETISLGNESKSFLLVAPNGSVWVQPKGGAFSYWNPQTNTLSSLEQCVISSSKKSLSDVMYTAMFDKLGNLWFCSIEQGLDLLSFNNNFSTLNLDPELTETTKHNVRSTMEDAQGNLWIASRTNKITILNPKKEFIGRLGGNGLLAKNSPGWGADIYHMFQDAQGNIWIGTRGNGLFRLSKTEKPFQFKVKQFKFKSDDIYSISSNHIYNIFQDSSGTIYVATWGGGLNIIRQTSHKLQFLNFRNELSHYPIQTADRVRTVIENKNNEIFFVTPYDLFSISKDHQNIENATFTKYPEVSGNDILDFIITSKNQLALATNGRGLLLVDVLEDGKTQVYCPFESIMGFPIEGVMAIQEDSLGHIWLMGENQVVRYNHEDQSAETFPELKAIIDAEIISEASKSQRKNGEIIIGYSNGAICFNPKNIKPLTYKPHLSISSFTVYNTDLHQVNPEVAKNSDILEKVTLKHDQNFFRIHLSALDYIKNESIVYRYKLEGVESQWNYFKGAQSINYTNLNKGDYKLIISSTNSHNLWVNNHRTLGITILPSIWETPLAYVAYVVVAFFVLFLVYGTILTIIKLRNDVNMEKQMAELKLKFFTDISHEIRTPLTMITAPVEKMLADNAVSEPVKKQLRVIERNSNRLLNLVNQILDLRRIQNRKLDIREINFSKFLKHISENFKELSEQRDIKLKLKVLVENPTIWADADSLDKIIINLMSNAFKYCKPGDTIKVILEETEKQLILKIEDNGPGISAEVQKRLFTRFYNHNINPSNPSTGIGLSIVKGLVEKHGATISVTSDEGKGSCFQLNFLKGYEHYNEDVDVVFKNEEVKQDLINEEEDEVVAIDVEKSHVKVGLIVEDDSELRAFMVSVLEKEYTIHEAENGKEGLALATKIQPNFIISDIMMPKMDGIEMLKRIRNNNDISHLPFVLLSAKTSIESRLEGMEYGADDYLTKPFNVSFLKARVKNILEQRERLQHMYSQGNMVEVVAKEQEETLKISQKDHQFMLKVIELVEENMTKSDFTVEELGNLMHMSRASFFNKLKALSGVSPVKFIRNIRLNKAASLLKTEDLLIKEVCFQVGFNDLKYFGKCFKAKFKSTPAEYRQKFR